MEKIKEFIKQNKVLLIALLVLILAIPAAYFLYQNYYNKNQQEVEQKKEAVKSSNTCKALTADAVTGLKGKSPFKPRLISEISFKVDKVVPGCQWSVDGTKTHDSMPVDNKCIFSKAAIVGTGVHTVSLTSPLDENCNVSVSVELE